VSDWRNAIFSWSALIGLDRQLDHRLSGEFHPLERLAGARHSVAGRGFMPASAMIMRRQKASSTSRALAVVGVRRGIPDLFLPTEFRWNLLALVRVPE